MITAFQMSKTFSIIGLPDLVLSKSLFSNYLSLYSANIIRCLHCIKMQNLATLSAGFSLETNEWFYRYLKTICVRLSRECDSTKCCFALICHQRLALVLNYRSLTLSLVHFQPNLRPSLFILAFTKSHRY